MRSFKIIGYRDNRNLGIIAGLDKNEAIDVGKIAWIIYVTLG